MKKSFLISGLKNDYKEGAEALCGSDRKSAQGLAQSGAKAFSIQVVGYSGDYQVPVRE